MLWNRVESIENQEVESLITNANHHKTKLFVQNTERIATALNNTFPKLKSLLPRFRSICRFCSDLQKTNGWFHFWLPIDLACNTAVPNRVHLESSSDPASLAYSVYVTREYQCSSLNRYIMLPRTSAAKQLCNIYSEAFLSIPHSPIHCVDKFNYYA